MHAFVTGLCVYVYARVRVVACTGINSPLSPRRERAKGGGRDAQREEERNNIGLTLLSSLLPAPPDDALRVSLTNDGILLAVHTYVSDQHAILSSPQLSAPPPPRHSFLHFDVKERATGLDVHCGFVSSHFFFRLRHVIQPVFDRPLAMRACASGESSGCFRGRPRGRFVERAVGVVPVVEGADVSAAASSDTRTALDRDPDDGRS